MKEDRNLKEIKTVKVQRFNHFELAEVFYEANCRMPPHAHEEARVSVVLGGTYTERFDRRSRFAKPALLVFHPTDEKHSVVFHNRGARIFSVKINVEWLDEFREYSEVLGSPRDFEGGLHSAHAARLYREFQRADKFSSLAVEALMLEMVIEASRKTSAKEQKIPRWLEQVREILHDQFSENLEINHLAQTVGIHPVHLAREFRRFFQCTPGEYMRRLRVESACWEIAESKLPLSEIALKYGFYDQSHFTNVFKRLTGMTPAQYKSVFC